MRRFVDLGRGVLAACMLSLMPGGASAEPEPPLVGEASLGRSDGLLREAVTAYALGDVAGARQLFEEAHLVEPTARTARGLGIVALREGRYRDAVHFFEEALASRVKPLSPLLHEGVTSLLAEARAHTGVLALVADPPCEALFEAGAAVPREPNGLLLAEPGFHRYTCVAQGHAPQELGVTLDAGSTTRLEVTLTPVLAPVSHDSGPVAASLVGASTHAGAPPELAGQPAARRSRARVRRAFWGLVGTTGAFGLAAIATGLVARSRIRGIEDVCGSHADGQCAGDELEQLSDSRHLERLGTLANLWLGLGGVGAAASLAVLPFYLRTPTAGEVTAGVGIRVGGKF